VVLNTFSYHLTPGGMMLDAGLREVGCVVIPGGVGNSAAQVELALAAGATGYVGTPQFLLVLLEKAVEMGTALGLERALVTGGPFLPAVREAVSTEHGIDAYESYGTADAGTLGFECVERAGWHVAPGVAIEITDPATGAPLPPGETGEVVVTSPNETYPLVRFGTGDLSAFVEGECPCGRTSARLKGFLGRVGEGVKVKGMFVHPRQIARALESYPAVGKWQGIVTTEGHQDRLTVRTEVEDASAFDAGAVLHALEEAAKLGLEVEVVAIGTIGEDGGRVVDERVVDERIT
jgi:phenylacetate-CoA ligase